jgi:hypothetical protein
MRANACEYRPLTGDHEVWEPGCNSRPAFQELTIAIHFPVLPGGPFKAGWKNCPYCGGYIVEVGDLGALAKRG